MEYSIHNGQIYDDSPYFITNIGVNGVPFRGVRRRNTANKKERKRTQSLNTAYTSLRDRIPNVPADTKLSKVNFLNGISMESFFFIFFYSLADKNP